MRQGRANRAWVRFPRLHSRLSSAPATSASSVARPGDAANQGFRFGGRRILREGSFSTRSPGAAHRLRAWEHRRDARRTSSWLQDPLGVGSGGDLFARRRRRAVGPLM